MTTLASAQALYDGQREGKHVDVRLVRENQDGLVFLSCAEIPELFVAVASDEEIRNAIDVTLKGAFHGTGSRVQVYTNGKITGPTIDAVVRISENS